MSPAHPMWELVRVPVVPLPIHLPANATGKAAEVSRSAWAPDPGSWLQQGLALAFATIW